VEVDNELVPGMLRKLLEERFAIKSHMEKRPLEAYALVADKPKMQKAYPQGPKRLQGAPRARWHRSAPREAHLRSAHIVSEFDHGSIRSKNARSMGRVLIVLVSLHTGP
jgi:uncharacterized protein (TIGR03435 family)